MTSQFNHLQINIEPSAMPFYKELFALLGWPVIHEDERFLGVGTSAASFWFMAAPGKSVTDYDQRGVNHVGIAVGTQADVDTVTDFLNGKGIPALFETPRHRPEFSAGPDDTYYQVMFESPDKVLFEAVYRGPRG